MWDSCSECPIISVLSNKVDISVSAKLQEYLGKKTLIVCNTDDEVCQVAGFLECKHVQYDILKCKTLNRTYANITAIFCRRQESKMYISAELFHS